MKHIFFSLSLLSACIHNAYALEALPGAVFTSEKHIRKHTDFKTLDLVKKLDGSFFTAVEIQDAFKVILMVFEIQYGKQDREAKKRTGLYLIDDTFITLKDLVKQERILTQENVEKTDARWAKHNETLKRIKADFNAKIKALEKADKASGSIAQGIQKKLIEFFLKDQGIDDIILRSPEDKTAFNNASATEFFRFLNNLKHFLEDLTDSCTVAHQNYKDIVKKAKESHKS